MRNEIQKIKHNTSNKKWAKNNRQRVNLYNRNWANKRSAFVMFLKEGKSCIFCGENHPSCLDFHHRDSTQKINEIQRLARSTSSNNLALFEEIKKCDLVCSNCHRKIHHNQRIKSE